MPAELSDQICEEHRLSVIREPENQTVTYDKWLGENAKASQRDMLRMTIDAALRMQPDGFDALMQMLEEAGCRIKRGAQISIKPPGAKRFIRLDTVGAVDIEAKLHSGKGKGYERWAERHNTDALASSMIYLKENQISSYAELESRIQAALDARNALKGRIRAAQARMEEISRQKKAILIYRRMKEVYAKFRESGWSPAFYREHKADIEAHKEAQAVYSAAGGKLPTLAELSEEYDLLLSQKRETGEEVSRLNEELKNLRRIKSNMDTLLDDERYKTNWHRYDEHNKPERCQCTDEKLR